jgi:hypothetical protein
MYLTPRWKHGHNLSCSECGELFKELRRYQIFLCKSWFHEVSWIVYVKEHVSKSLAYITGTPNGKILLHICRCLALDMVSVPLHCLNKCFVSTEEEI